MLGRFINSGNYQKATQFMSAVTFVLNGDTSKEGEGDRVAVSQPFAFGKRDACLFTFNAEIIR